MLGHLLGALLPVVAGAITHPLYDALQKGVGALGKLPPPITRVVVGVTGAGIYALGAKGFQLAGGDLTTLTPADVGMLASAGLAYVFKLTAKVS